MSGTPVCPTATDALVQALTAAVGTPPNETFAGRLDKAEFGRFAAAGAGWYWQLDVTREYRSDPKHRHDQDDTAGRRIRMIVEKWELDVSRYEELDRAGAACRDDSDLKFGEEK